MRTPQKGRLKLGTGKSDITPRPGVALSGFGPYLNRNSTRVHTPLLARCLYLRASGEAVIILSLELCGLSPEQDSLIRKRVASEIHMDADRVFISCTHTHSAPQTVGHIGWGHPDDLYLETLPGRILPAVKAALGTPEPVTLRYAAPPCEQIGFNRERDRAYDRSMPVEKLLDPEWYPAHPELTDTICRQLIFSNERGVHAILHNFGCHPVVCCEACTQIHGDYPGLASRAFEAAHPDSTAVFLPGALGDINPPVSHRPEPESMKALDVIARRYSRVLETGLEQAEELDSCVLENQLRRVRLPRVKWDVSIVEEKIFQLEHKLHHAGLDDNPLAGSNNPLERIGIDMVRLAGLRKLRERMRTGEELNHPVPIHGIRIGPVRILGVPLELYNATRLAIESHIPESPCMLVSLANGSLGYAPNEDSYEANPYAAEFVSLMGGHLPFLCLHDILVEELTGLLN